MIFDMGNRATREELLSDPKFTCEYAEEVFVSDKEYDLVMDYEQMNNNAVRDKITFRTSDGTFTKIIWKLVHHEQFVLLHDDHLYHVRPDFISSCIEEKIEQVPIHSRYVLNPTCTFTNKYVYTGSLIISSLNIPASTTYKVYKYYPKTLTHHLKQNQPTLSELITIMRQLCQGLISLRQYYKPCLDLRTTVFVKKLDPLTITIDRDIKYSTYSNLPENIGSDTDSEKESATVWVLGNFLQILITGDSINWQHSIDGFKQAIELAEVNIRVRFFVSLLIIELHKNFEW